MSCWAIVPIKSLQNGKTRLRPVLSDQARRRLIAEMFRHVVSSACRAREIEGVAVLGPPETELPARIPLIVDRGRDLNSAIAGALPDMAALGARRLVILPADLPMLTTDDVDDLARAAGDGAIGIASDNSSRGTNGLSLALSTHFPFAFGDESFRRHCAAARELDLAVRRVNSESLGFDVDDASALEHPAVVAILGKRAAGEVA